MSESEPAIESDLNRTLASIESIYGSAVVSHGPRHAGVGWSSRPSQMLRLQTLLRILEGETAATITAADLGCGYGALWPLLEPLTAPRVTAYTGLDRAPEMLAAARTLYGRDPRVRFERASLPSETVDYGFVSGTFNFRKDATDDDWRGYIESSLTAFAGSCRRGLAFNLLSEGSPRRHRTMFYAKADEWWAFGRTLADRRGGTATLETGYLADDFSVFLRFPA